MIRYESNIALYHHGVKGMKWGKRKARYDEYNGPSSAQTKYNLKRAKAAKKTANKEYSKAFNKSTSLVGAYGPNQDRNARNVLKTAEKANAADQKYKQAKKAHKNAVRGEKRVAKMMAKMEKQAYKDAINKRVKEINSGESFVGRLYNKATGADRIRAELEYDMDKRARVNKNWRD